MRINKIMEMDKALVKCEAFLQHRPLKEKGAIHSLFTICQENSVLLSLCMAALLIEKIGKTAIN